MDGEQRAAAEKGRVGGEGGAQVGGHQSRLPVVAVEDVGAEQEAGDAERGAAEDGKANVVVRIVQAGFAVEAFAVEEGRAIHQVDGKFGRRLIDGEVDRHRAEVHRQVVPDAPRGFQFDGPVARDDDGDFIAVRRASARGSEPTTSARPPVLANGAASEETIRTRDTKRLYQAP